MQRYVAPSPVLCDSAWLVEFESLVRRFWSLGSDFANNRFLPGYPLLSHFQDLQTTYSWLSAHLNKAAVTPPTLGAFDGKPGEEEKILRAYRWTVHLVESSTQRLGSPNSDPASNPDYPWVPTQAELESLKAILDLLSAFDFQATLQEQQSRLNEQGPGDERSEAVPRWDPDNRQLLYGNVVCRDIKRYAPAQMRVLEAFEAAEWKTPIRAPFRDKQLTDIICNLNKKMEPGSPIWFEAKGPSRMAWRLL
jgi:hypothetical protein